MNPDKYPWTGISAEGPSVLYCQRCKTTEPYNNDMLVRELCEQFHAFRLAHKDCPEPAPQSLPCPGILKCEHMIDHNGQHKNGEVEWWE